MTSPGAAGGPGSRASCRLKLLADPGREGVGEQVQRGGAALIIVRDRPGRGRRRLGRRRERPQLHHARMLRPVGEMAEGRPGATTPRAAADSRIPDRPARARARLSGTRRRGGVQPAFTGFLHAAAQPLASRIEAADIGALEREDGLLAVADREHGAVVPVRRPSPAKNSAVSAWAMRHCAGAVSCASSSSKWSMPPSSLKSTQAAPGSTSRAEVRLIRSSKSSLPCRILAAGVAVDHGLRRARSGRPTRMPFPARGIRPRRGGCARPRPGIPATSRGKFRRVSCQRKSCRRVLCRRPAGTRRPRRASARSAAPAPSPTSRARGRPCRGNRRAALGHALGGFPQSLALRPGDRGGAHIRDLACGDAECPALRFRKSLTERERAGEAFTIGGECRGQFSEFAGANQSRDHAHGRLQRGAARTGEHGFAGVAHRFAGIAVIDQLEMRRNFASSGKRRSRDWQKAWMVPIRMPPGRSSTSASSDLARSRLRGSGATSSARRAASSAGVVKRDPVAQAALQT